MQYLNLYWFQYGSYKKVSVGVLCVDCIGENVREYVFEEDEKSI